MAYILICKKLGKRDRKYLVYFNLYGQKTDAPEACIFDSIEAAQDGLAPAGRWNPPALLGTQSIEIAQVSPEIVDTLRVMGAKIAKGEWKQSTTR